jgi:hypothetical protein
MNVQGSFWERRSTEDIQTRSQILGKRRAQKTSKTMNAILGKKKKQCDGREREKKSKEDLYTEKEDT